MAESASQVVEAPGSSVHFSLEPILVELERGCYIGLIPPVSMANLVAGRRSAVRCAPKSDGGGRNNRNKKPLPKLDVTGGPAQVRARYDVHLPSLYLWDGENSWSIMVGAVLPTLQSHVIYKN